jgi:hypothetical protein
MEEEGGDADRGPLVREPLMVLASRVISRRLRAANQANQMQEPDRLVVLMLALNNLDQLNSQKERCFPIKFCN